RAGERVAEPPPERREQVSRVGAEHVPCRGQKALLDREKLRLGGRGGQRRRKVDERVREPLRGRAQRMSRLPCGQSIEGTPGPVHIAAAQRGPKVRERRGRAAVEKQI